MISSIRLDGTTACMHLPGAADTEALVTYVDEVLCPTLRRGGRRGNGQPRRA